MRVYVCRHAEAAPGPPDELRALTPRGIEQAEALAARLAAEAQRPRLVLTSPLVRARQTAEIVAGALGADTLIDSRLAPGATGATLRDALEGLSGPIATVGHQPDCGLIVAAVTGSASTFPPAGFVAVDLAQDTAS